MDWLLDHKADFEMLCFRASGHTVEVDWANPRLICIARNFTKYDDYAIEQINRNIELIRYRIFDDNFVVLEQASSTSQSNPTQNTTNGGQKYKGVKDYLESMNDKAQSLFEEIETFIFSLGDDLQKKELKYYLAYTRIKNFISLEYHPKDNKFALFLKVDPKTLDLTPNNIRDVSEIGHYGTGDTEVIVRNLDDLERAKPLIEKSYNLS